MINEIIIPKSIKSIGKYAFLLKKDSIESIHYNGTLSDWMSIRFSSKFSNPMELADRIYMLNHDHDYYELTSSNTIIIDDSITILGDYQLSGITSFENLYLSKNVKEIGKNVFGSYDVLIDNLYYSGTIIDWCNIKFSDKYTIATDINNIHLMSDETYEKIEKEVVIPSDVGTINKYQFSGFRKVETFIIQEGVTTIKENAFANCYGLKSVVFPLSLSLIEKDVFVECSRLESVYYCGDKLQYELIEMPKLTYLTYYYSEQEPLEKGDYWHYEEDKIVVWEKD